MTNSNALIRSLGQRLGLELQLGSAQQCAVSFDGDLLMMFLADESDHMTAVAHVMDVGQGPDAAKIAERALLCNFAIQALGGHRLSVDPSDNSLVLTANWNAAACDAATFYADVEWFVNLLSALRTDLQQVVQAALEGRLRESVQASSLASHLIQRV
jgi:hypothetical protein